MQDNHVQDVLQVPEGTAQKEMRRELPEQHEQVVKVSLCQTAHLLPSHLPFLKLLLLNSATMKMLYMELFGL